MITANFKKNKFTIKGHANFSTHGNDIVCAGVSTLVFAFLECAEILQSEVKKGFVKCEFTESEQNREYLKMLLVGLQLIATQFPENVEVKTWK